MKDKRTQKIWIRMLCLNSSEFV